MNARSRCMARGASLLLALAALGMTACQSSLSVYSKEVQKLKGHALNIDPSGGARSVAPDDLRQARIDEQHHDWVRQLARVGSTAGVGQLDITDCRAEFANNPSKGPVIDRAIDQILYGLQEFADNAPGVSPHVVLFVHGGRVGLDKGIKHSASTMEALERDLARSQEQGQLPFYPIFLHWDTQELSAARNHLIRVRDGREVGLAQGVATSPFVLSAEIGRAASRSPILFFKQGQGLWQDWTTDDSVRKPAGWTHIRVPGQRPPNGDLSGALLDVFPGVLRLATIPLLDIFGQGAYDDMRRRARVLFDLDADFQTAKFRSCGGLTRLFNELRTFERVALMEQPIDWPNGELTFGRHDRREGIITDLRVGQAQRRACHSKEPLADESKLKQDVRSGACRNREDSSSRRARWARIKQLRERIRRDGRTLRISIVSHSMGGIIANEILRRNPDLYFEDVVYMAPANSIREFASDALPYLKANPTTQFHIYTLHPYRERSERAAWNVVPKGSLLTWVDRFLTKPSNEFDRTMGDWRNLFRTLTLLQYLESHERERLHVQVFGFDPTQPQKHGDFNDPPALDSVGQGYPGSRFWKWHMCTLEADPDTCVAEPTLDIFTQVPSP